MVGVCFSDFLVTFSFGETEASLLLDAGGFFVVTYVGPPPTSLLDSVTLNKISGMDFCLGFPGSIVVSPVCN